MDPVEQFALAWHALSRALPDSLRRGFALPWALHLALHVAAAVLLWNFAHPVFSDFAASWLRRLAGESALHYPDAPRAIPLALARADAAVAWLLTPVIAAWSVAMVARRLRRQPEGASPAFGDMLARLPGVLPAGALIVLARAALVALAALALGNLGHRPMLGAATWFGAVAGEFALLAIAALLLPLLAADDAPITQLRWRWAYAWHRAGVAAIAIAAVITCLGVVSRLAMARLSAAAAVAPDAMPLLAIGGALLAAMGGTLFCVASAIAYVSLVRDVE